MTEHPPLTPRSVFVGTALTAVAGYVDCFGYISFGQVYTAQMSGNTVLIAVHAGHGEAVNALIHAYTVVVFVLGLLISSVAIELGLRRGIRRVLALALAIEIACLVVFAACGVPFVAGSAADAIRAANWPLLLLIGLTAIAMGIQNTSLRMTGVLAIFTTHVTGDLARFGEQFAAYLVGPKGKAGHASQAWFAIGLWFAFLLGALLASELQPRWSSAEVLALPIAMLLVVIAMDLVEPFADPQSPRSGA